MTDTPDPEIMDAITLLMASTGRTAEYEQCRKAMTDTMRERLARAAAKCGDVSYERCPKYWLSVTDAILAEPPSESMRIAAGDMADGYGDLCGQNVIDLWQGMNRYIRDGGK